MTRYVSRPPRPCPRRAKAEIEWHDEPTFAEGKTVHEPEVDTYSGLLDAEGNELHRVRMSIGFRIGDRD